MKMMKNAERDENIMDYNQTPFGYGFMPASNAIDGDGYSNMSDDEKREYIERHRSILSESELDRLTASLGEDEDDGPNFQDPLSLFHGPGIG